ncbi:lipoprotein-anchoring transpeptidase ErfK/SrfK [Pseudonocardia sediminis]|uniref:Lipoprotein-anchoring transpeptidase ErfK/SrfK n=1 Tax=Pseudonocardia sediminis TaxID=1397368 RepID=A0A4Q7UPV1_PSEST|nr:Ig-like domain-containing protein [Pseudonocardia sediminis]RZT83752.1 lipoprotein-anchoring transpeptidase ErfK/SrfK [Pseudonocardia sediminis]
MRRLLIVAVAIIGVLGVVTAVATAGGRPGLGTAPTGPDTAVSYEPAAGATGLNPTAPVAVRAAEGTLDRVALSDPDGDPVEGGLNAERTAWTASEPLDYATTYTWSGRATGGDGEVVPLQGTVATLTPAEEVRGTLNIGDDRTVGVAAPIEIQFDTHVDDRAAVERRLTVTTSREVEGAWGWLPDENGGSRVHWRPREYWPANTDVTVDAPLYGVDYGGGKFGQSDLTSAFTIGRKQVVKADTGSFRMVVERDGKQVGSYPASYGLGSDPNRNTRSGIHVVTEKFTDKRMVSAQYGYDVMEKWAVRMSNNGEFIHANPASSGAQGSSNVTHGCVNLSLADAKAYYDTALYGDPVEVTGTPVQLSPKDGDVWDWTLSWEKWQQLSAL